MSRDAFKAVVKEAAKMAAKSFLRYLVATFGVATSIPPVGVAGATTAIILGQVSMAAVLDYFGLFGLEKIPFCWYRILGALAMAGGAWLMLRRQ